MQEDIHQISDADWQLLQMTKGEILDDPFWYIFPLFTNIASLGSQTQIIQFQVDSFFRIERISCHFTLADAAFLYNTRPMPNASLTLTDSGSGRQLMNAPIPITSLSGYEGEEYDLVIPKIIVPGATLTGTVLNFDAAVNTGQYRIALGGRKLYNVKSR